MSIPAGSVSILSLMRRNIAQPSYFSLKAKRGIKLRLQRKKG